MHTDMMQERDDAIVATAAAHADTERTHLREQRKCSELMAAQTALAVASQRAEVSQVGILPIMLP